MNVVFVSNYLNHHQQPFCEEMLKRCDSFYFVETESSNFQGYQSHIDAPYVLKYFDDRERIAVIDRIVNADAVIFGDCPNKLISKRMAENKLSFFYSERFFKKGTWRRFIPTTRKKIENRLINYKDKNLYVLCASAYLPYDISFFGFPENKCFKWGYFPEIKKYDSLSTVLDDKKPASLLWAGRFLQWKHPEIAVEAARRLKADGYSFNLCLVGSGDTEQAIERLIGKYNLGDCVEMAGSKTPDEVRSYMENSQIFLFTSDRNEGWGAVLNESMNSGCAVIANEQIGSAPFLIRTGENGFVYHRGKVDELYANLKYLLDNDNERRMIQDNAYNTMVKMWNVQTAAERFVGLCDAILCGKPTPYKNGVCSNAEILREDCLR